MSALLSFFSQVPVIGWVSLVSALLFIAFIWWSRANEAAFFDFLMNFPIRLFGYIGRVKQLKANTTNLNSRDSWRNGMPTQERELCSAYIDKMGVISSERQFNNAVEYLGVTGQASVRPLSIGIWIVLFILTLGEAIGTGFFIAPYVSQHITSSQALPVAMALAIVLAIMLLGLTHMAGITFFERKTIREILGQIDGEASPEGYRNGEDIIYGSNHDQLADRGRTQAVRFYSRLNAKKYRGTLSWTITATILLLAVVVTVFGGRYYELGEKSTNEVQAVNMEQGTGSDPFSSMMPSDLPKNVLDAQAETRGKIAEEVASSRFGQGMMAAILLAMFYLIVQAVGFAATVTHSFFQSGSKAYKDSRGCSTYEEYIGKYFTPFATRAQSRLDELRAQYARVNEKYGSIVPTISFVEYYHLRKNEQNNAPQAAHEWHAREQERAAAASSPAPMLAPTLNVEPGHAEAKLYDLAREIRGLPDRDTRQARLAGALASLSLDQQSGLRAIMTSMKEEDERRQKSAMVQFEDLI